MTELNVPVLNATQAQLAFQNGADCVYTGIQGLSIDFKGSNAKEIAGARGAFGKKLECVVDRYFHQGDFEGIRAKLQESGGLFDRFTVSDLGLIPLLKELFPRAEICISDYANCTNSSAATLFGRLGAKRVLLGQECTLEDVRQICSNCPEMETEVAVEGPLNMVYSGRSLLSTYFEKNGKPCGVDENALALEEESRNGTYYPFTETNGETTIHESKDLSMISHMEELLACKVASLRILGYSRSEEDLARTVKAYKQAIDAVSEGNHQAAKEAAELLNGTGSKVKTTGFYL